MYDAIVIGARCAGAATAMLLARRGRRVLLVDRAAFPSDTLSTHLLHPRGGAKLAGWGLLDRLRATGVPPIPAVTFDIGGTSVTGAAEPVDGVVEWLCPRRTVLDHLLVEAAAEAGCEVREQTSLHRLVWDDDRVAGVRLRDRSGHVVEERSAIVVGADGMRSTVARQVGATTYNEHPSQIGTFYTYWSGVGITNAEFHVRRGRHILAFPTHDGLTCIFVARPAHEFPAYRADVEGTYLRTLELAPDLASRVGRGNRAAPFRGTNVLPNYYRKPHGPGWALVGDAGHHKDPTTGMGMSDAFRDADLLAGAIDDGLAGRADPAAALAAYEQERNRQSEHIYGWTLFAAALPDPAPLAPYLHAIAADPVERTRFLSVVAGTVPYGEVFDHGRQARVLAAANGSPPTSGAVRSAS
ncbi:MAG: NAD(P)/FAD-dependent oxidoreductase [Acidimicrobiia bacterium]